MRHFDYEWDLEPWGIKFDPELNIDKQLSNLLKDTR